MPSPLAWAMFVKWHEKLFCELLEQLWCFLHGSWRLMVGPGGFLLGFRMDFCESQRCSPVPNGRAGPPSPMVPPSSFFDVIC